MHIRKLPPFHFAVFGVVPILTLYANNVEQVFAAQVMRSLILSLLLAIATYGACRLILRQSTKAALLASIALILFYTYGHIYSILKAMELSGNVIGRHRYLAPLWLVMLVAAGWMIWRRNQVGSETLNLISLFVLAFPLFQLAVFGFRLQNAASTSTQQPDLEVCQAPSGSRPDIYYIVLDEYPRADALAEIFDFDNSSFIEGLTSLGFYVAPQSQSNYAQTELSLASSMNFDYLDALSEDFFSGSDDRSGLWNLIRDGRVRQLLENYGYRTIAFETGYMWTEMRDADPFIARNRSVMNQLQVGQNLNAFESMLFRTTAGIVVTDGAVVIPEAIKPDVNAPYQDHRERILFVFDQLEELPAMGGPKFVFAHLVTPHLPFVFGPDGEEVDNEGPFTLLDQGETVNRELFNSRFIDQLSYVNLRIEGVIESLVGGKGQDPIVIIQADHGAGGISPDRRVSILNAYYLPEQARRLLYPTITPVNTFRIILNDALGCEFELLPDISHFSTYQDPYTYQIVPTPTALPPGQ